MRLELAAIPAYFATMGAERAYLRRRAQREGPSAADYEWRDTATSLTMGVGSLLVPLVAPKVLGPITPGVGRYGRALVTGAATSALVTTIADRLAREHEDAGELAPPPEPEQAAPARARRRRLARAARKAAEVGAVATVVAGGAAVTTALAHRTRAGALWRRRVLPDLGTGALAWTVAIVGWDALYYCNHRLWHETRFMWANHVMHHSSERYNLSTALRQSVTDPFLVLVPYGGLALFGVRPELITQSRAINLLYQYWIHTDTIERLGPAEELMNTPSHHRAHHGSNRRYIDRNHAGIFIVWDRLFGTFERESEPVVFGLTKNIGTFNPLGVATHEYADMLRDVAASTNWRDRLSFVLRGPGWAYERHAAAAAPLAPVAREAEPVPA